MLELLSNREQAIARLLVLGNSKKEIADKACISYATADTHTRNIYRKAEVKKLSDFVREYLVEKYKLPQNLVLAFIMISSMWQGFTMNDQERPRANI